MEEAGRKIYSVSEITRDIKGILEDTFGAVWVEGEISNCRPSSAGHCYFSLKDDGALLSGVMWKGIYQGVKFKLEDGLKVVCFGSVDVYPPRGQYQLIVERIEPKGIGGLQLALEQLKEKLQKEGLFAPAHKRPIPYLPSRIGIVTSPTGAAIKDMLKVLDRRFKDVHILVAPVKVQGDGAKEEIAQAIKDFNEYNAGLPAKEKIEVLIVGRGGGSIEDLWAFNEEVVCRAIYASRIPVISAVGHERDVTVSDLVADVRAATPSVAAELVLPMKEELSEKVGSLADSLKTAFLDLAEASEDRRQMLQHRLALAAGHILELNTNRLVQTAKKLAILNPAVQIPQYKEKMLDLARQATVRMEHCLKMKSSQFTACIQRLAALNPLNILERGYSVTFNGSGTVVKDARSLTPGETLRTKLSKGEVISEVKETKE
jgi:exodeoxyribonuclease VII large subunit